MVKDIKGYKILNVKLDDITHHILYKKHETNNGDGKDQRSIFFCNLPISTNIKVLKKVFATISIGATIETFINSYLTDSIEDHYIDLSKLTSDLPLDGNGPDDMMYKLPKNCGILTFIDKSAFQLAFNSLIKLSNNQDIITWPITSKEFGGSSYFLNNFKCQILDIDQVSQDVTSSLMAFDKAEQDSINNFQQQKNLVDDDGFTLVVGPQRKTKAGILGNQQNLTAKLQSDQQQTKQKKKEKEDFYRFQLRQRKKDEMNDLLKKFKADQEKVKQMTEKKRFRPY